MRSVWTVTLLIFTISLFAAPVGVESARQAAGNWFEMRTGRSAELACASDSPDNGYWLFEAANGGYVLVACDDAAYPIIAWSPSNRFDTNAGHPAIQLFLNSVERQMRHVATERTSNQAMRPVWNAVLNRDDIPWSIDRDVEPLITSQWHQRFPYNVMCPEDAASEDGHVVVGCCATAAVQLMRYWAHPVHGVGSHSYEHWNYGTLFADFAAAEYVWEDMPDTTDTYIEEVAEICYHAGVAMDMDYSANSSGAPYDAVYYALTTHFSYNPATQLLPRHSYTDSLWDEMIRGELDQARPVYYFGQEDDGGGHAFLIDGYDELDHFHVNWGWGGSCDGYYYFSALAPGSHDYTPVQFAFFDMYPVEASEFAAPTNLAAEVTDENNVRLTWSPPVSDEGTWCWNCDEMSVIMFSGPERGIDYDVTDFGLSYPVTLQQIQHDFYDHSMNPWGDNDQFTVKIYDSDRETLLFESSAQTALRHPTLTTYALETPLTVYDDFCVSIHPLDAETFNPASTGGYTSGNYHSWWGEPGAWEPNDAEWMTGVCVVEESTGRRTTIQNEPMRNRMLLGYNLYRNDEIVNPLWLVDTEYLDEDLAPGHYTYTVKAIYDLGESNHSNAAAVDIGTGVHDNATEFAPHNLAVRPNPFNPEATVSFSLGAPDNVAVDVFNVRGQRVRRLHSGMLEAGDHQLVWNGVDEQSRPCASGLYFIQLSASSTQIRKKVILLK